MAISYPQINGNAVSFAEVEVRLIGSKTQGLKSVGYKPEKKSKKVYGTGSRPIARTRGTADFTGSIEFYRADFDDFLIDLTDLEGRGPMDQEFDVLVSYGASPTDAVTDVLSACRITAIDINPQQGDEPITVKVDLDVMGITMNGIDLVPEMDEVD